MGSRILERSKYFDYMRCCEGVREEGVGGDKMSSNVFYLGILWYPIWRKILSSFWGIVSYIRNLILLGSTTKKPLRRWAVFQDFFISLLLT